MRSWPIPFQELEQSIGGDDEGISQPEQRLDGTDAIRDGEGRNQPGPDDVGLDDRVAVRQIEPGEIEGCPGDDFYFGSPVSRVHENPIIPGLNRDGTVAEAGFEKTPKWMVAVVLKENNRPSQAYRSLPNLGTVE